MRTLLRNFVVAVGCALIVGCAQDAKPAISDIEASLKSYLLAEKSRTCGGTVTIDRLTITRIGDYEDKYGGWPVYAIFGVTCVDGSNFSTWNHDDTSSTAWASIARKKLSGDYECYMPELFRERDNDLSRQMDRLPTDMTPKVTTPR